MENYFETFLREVEDGVEVSDAPPETPFIEKAPDEHAKDEHVEKDKVQTSGLEIWSAILKACETVPKPLRHSFVVQVLVSILDDQPVSTGSLHKALQKAFEAVQRVHEARQIKLAA